MGRLVEEVREWNTPVVGAYLLWCFTRGFVNNHPNGDAPVAILHFIALGILTNQEICNAINGHRPNLPSLVRWFNEEKKSDLLACLNQRIRQKRNYTLKSIDIAVASGLLAWDSDTAKLYPASLRIKKETVSKGISVQSIGKKAEILGKWFAQCDLSTLTAYLGVVL